MNHSVAYIAKRLWPVVSQDEFGPFFPKLRNKN